MREGGEGRERDDKMKREKERERERVKAKQLAGRSSRKRGEERVRE